MFNRPKVATEGFSENMRHFHRRLCNISQSVIRLINEANPCLNMSEGLLLFSIERKFAPTAYYDIHFEVDLMRTQLSAVLKHHGIDCSDSWNGLSIGEAEYDKKPMTNELFAEVLKAITDQMKAKPVEAEPANVRPFLGITN